MVQAKLSINRKNTTCVWLEVKVASSYDFPQSCSMDQVQLVTEYYVWTRFA